MRKLNARTVVRCILVRMLPHHKKVVFEETFLTYNVIIWLTINRKWSPVPVKRLHQRKFSKGKKLQSNIFSTASQERSRVESEENEYYNAGLNKIFENWENNEQLRDEMNACQ